MSPKPPRTEWRKFVIVSKRKAPSGEDERSYADRIERLARVNGWLYGKPFYETRKPQ